MKNSFAKKVLIKNNSSIQTNILLFVTEGPKVWKARKSVSIFEVLTDSFLRTSAIIRDIKFPSFFMTVRSISSLWVLSRIGRGLFMMGKFVFLFIRERFRNLAVRVSLRLVLRRRQILRNLFITSLLMRLFWI